MIFPNRVLNVPSQDSPLPQFKIPARQRKAIKKLETAIIENDVNLASTAASYANWNCVLPCSQTYPLSEATKRLRVDIIKIIVKRLPPSCYEKQIVHALSELLHNWDESERSSYVLVQCLEALLPAQKIPCAFDENGNPWVLTVLSKNNLYLAKCLERIGVEVDAADESGSTIAHEAIKNENHEILNWALTAKPELIHQQDNNGDTPLHIAVSCGKLALVELLESFNPDLWQLNNDGLSPLQLANHLELIEWASGKMKMHLVKKIKKVENPPTIHNMSKERF